MQSTIIIWITKRMIFIKLLLYFNKNSCAGLSFLCSVLFQIYDASLLYFSEVKIMVCCKFEVSFFIIRKSRKNHFLRKTDGLAKRLVHFREWLHFLAEIIGVFNSLIKPFETCLLFLIITQIVSWKFLFKLGSVLNWWASWITSDMTFLI